MKKSLAVTAIVAVLSSSASFAQGLSIGDAKVDTGQLKLSGAIRSRFLHKDYADPASEGSNNDWKLADIKLVLNYENPNWLASVDTRCYQYESLCDAVFLKDAWVGYKFNDEQRLTVGLQPVEFGYGNLWGNSYYETLLNTVGLEDIHNLGVKYQFKNQDYRLALGFYPQDGGNYKGSSKDSSRYSGNFVTADDLNSGTDLEEKNMWIATAAKKINLNQDYGLKTEIGASYWYSELDNKISHTEGTRKAWNIFALTELNAWQWLFVAGAQDIDNADRLHPQYSTIGAFDFPYQVANHANFWVNELSYAVKQPIFQMENIKPYISYSQFSKDESTFQDSERLMTGVYFNYKSIGVQGEYIWSKNDPMTGSSGRGLAQGDQNGWNQLFYLSIGYYF